MARPEDEILWAERRALALNLRRRNWSLARIAKKLGVCMQRAHQLVSEELAKIPDTQAAELRKLSLERLDRLGARLDKNLCSLDERVATEAAQALIRLEDRRARLLGLDEVTKVDSKVKVTVGAPDTKDLTAEQLAEVAEAIAADLRSRNTGGDKG